MEVVRPTFQLPPSLGQQQKKKGFSLFKKKSKKELSRLDLHAAQQAAFQPQNHHVMQPGKANYQMNIYPMPPQQQHTGGKRDDEHHKRRSHHHRSSKPPKSETVRSEWDIQTQTVSLDASGRNYSSSPNSGTMSTGLIRTVMNDEDSGKPARESPMMQNKMDQVPGNLQSKTVVDLRGSAPDGGQKHGEKVQNGFTHSTKSSRSSHVPVDWGDAKYRYNKEQATHELHVSSSESPQDYSSTPMHAQHDSSPIMPLQNSSPNRYMGENTKTRPQNSNNQANRYYGTSGGQPHHSETFQHNQNMINTHGHSQNYPPRPRSIGDQSEYRYEDGWNVQHVYAGGQSIETNTPHKEINYQSSAMKTSPWVGNPDRPMPNLASTDPGYRYNAGWHELHVHEENNQSQPYMNTSAINSNAINGHNAVSSSSHGFANYPQGPAPYNPEPMMAHQSQIEQGGIGSASIPVKRGLAGDLSQSPAAYSQTRSNSAMANGYNNYTQNHMTGSSSTANSSSPYEYHPNIASVSTTVDHHMRGGNQFGSKQHGGAAVTVTGSILVSQFDDLDTTPAPSLYGAPSHVEASLPGSENDLSNRSTGSVVNVDYVKPDYDDKQWTSIKATNSGNKAPDPVDIPIERSTSMARNSAFIPENTNPLVNEINQTATPDPVHNDNIGLNSRNSRNSAGVFASSQDIPSPPSFPQNVPPAPPAVIPGSAPKRLSRIESEPAPLQPNRFLQGQNNGQQVDRAASQETPQAPSFPQAAAPAPPPIPSGGIPKKLTRIESEPAPLRPNRFLQDQGQGAGQAHQASRHGKEGASMGALAERIAAMARQRAERMGTQGDHLP